MQGENRKLGEVLREKDVIIQSYIKLLRRTAWDRVSMIEESDERAKEYDILAQMMEDNCRQFNVEMPTYKEAEEEFGEE